MTKISNRHFANYDNYFLGRFIANFRRRIYVSTWYPRTNIRASTSTSASSAGKRRRVSSPTSPKTSRRIWFISTGIRSKLERLPPVTFPEFTRRRTIPSWPPWKLSPRGKGTRPSHKRPIFRPLDRSLFCFVSSDTEDEEESTEPDKQLPSTSSEYHDPVVTYTTAAAETTVPSTILLTSVSKQDARNQEELFPMFVIAKDEVVEMSSSSDAWNMVGSYDVESGVLIPFQTDEESLFEEHFGWFWLIKHISPKIVVYFVTTGYVSPSVEKLRWGIQEVVSWFLNIIVRTYCTQGDDSTENGQNACLQIFVNQLAAKLQWKIRKEVQTDMLLLPIQEAGLFWGSKCLERIITFYCGYD